MKLKKEKAEVIVFVIWQGIEPKNQVKNLGVLTESNQSFNIHVQVNIAKVRNPMTKKDLKKMVHAFISSKMDNCNRLLTGLPKKTIRHLQLLTKNKRTVLKSLHWLSV